MDWTAGTSAIDDDKPVKKLFFDIHKEGGHICRVPIRQ